MVHGIWDSYADWAQLAKEEDFSIIKRTQKGPVWKPNDISPELADFFTTIGTQKDQSPPTCVVDFGCGLGRNAPLLRRFFPRVVAVDIPEMTEKLKCLHGDNLPNLYDGVYTSFTEAAKDSPIHILYDSIVLQHIIDIPYLTALTRSFLDHQPLKTITSISYRSSISPIINWLTQDHGYQLIHTEIDQTSYANDHTIRIIQRSA